MNDRPCIRCHHPLTLEEGHLTFCSDCGAPQIFLSQELQTELADGARAFAERAVVADPASTHNGPTPTRRRRLLRPVAGQSAEQPWTVAVPYALLSAGITLGLGALSLLLPPFGILMLLWIIGAPVLTVAYFNARRPPTQVPGAGFAARLGLLTGLLVTFASGAIFTLSLLLTRFAFHDADLLDTQLAASFDQQRAVILARLGSGAQPTLDLFLIPEYRVGMLLFVLAASALLYLLLSTLAGGAAGVVLRRRQGA